MSLLSCASRNSRSRGYDYYKNKKVKQITKLSNSQIYGQVSGDEVYFVHIDIEHPRNSQCNCPFASEHRVICKHMVALLFEAFPDEAKKYWDAELAAVEEYENWQEQVDNLLPAFINSCTKNQLKDIIWDLLNYIPEWKFSQLVQEWLDID